MNAAFLLWLVLTIGVPLFAPMCSLLAIAPVIGPQTARTMIWESIRDGQLFWVAIGLCTAGIYEVATTICAPAWPSVFCVAFMLFFCALVVFSVSMLTAYIAMHAFGRENGVLSAPAPSSRETAIIIQTPPLYSLPQFVNRSIWGAGLGAGAAILFHAGTTVWPVLI